MSGASNLFNAQVSSGVTCTSSSYLNIITQNESFPDFPYDVAAVPPPASSFIMFGFGRFLFSIFM